MQFQLTATNNKTKSMQTTSNLITHFALTSGAGIFASIFNEKLYGFTWQCNYAMDITDNFMQLYDINAVYNNCSNVSLPKFDVIYAFEYRQCFTFVVFFFLLALLCSVLVMIATNKYKVRVHFFYTNLTSH